MSTRFGSRPACRHRLSIALRSHVFPAPVWRHVGPGQMPMSRPPAAAAVPSSTELPLKHPAEALLQWACSGWSGSQSDDDGGMSAAGPRRGGGKSLELRLVARDLGPDRGCGLVATADIAPGETLLSVPLTRVFTSDPDSELHWSAEMALRLLRARHLAWQTPDAGASTEGEASGDSHDGAAGVAATGARMAVSTGAVGVGRPGKGLDDAGPELLGEAGWGPWIAALPAAVRTPLEYGEEEIRQLGCPYVMEEIRVMQQCISDCFGVLQPELEELGCGWQDFLWAVQIFHSRCFFESSSGSHMCVPGVDLANHSPRPSAAVRLLHSPGACQGYDALAEVADAPAPEPSRFNLVAGEAGIRCGEEVTISYGRWPSEAFLLLFGFVPGAGSGSTEGAAGHRPGSGEGGGSGDVCPGDCLMVFRDAEEAVRWCVEAASGRRRQQHQNQHQPLPQAVDYGDELETILRKTVEAMTEDLSLNLSVTPEGVDCRLQGVMEMASRALGMDPRALLRSRLQERLSHFSSGDDAQSDKAIGLFVRSKSALARCVLNQL